MPHCAKPLLKRPVVHVPNGCLLAASPRFIYARNHLHLLLLLPRQVEHQCVRFRLCLRHRGGRFRRFARPRQKGPGSGAPRARAVMHKQLDARGPRVGKRVAVMRLDSAAHLHHGANSRSGPTRMSTGTVASHSTSMRITAANSAAHSTCQPTLTVATPRWRSSEISGEATTAFCTAMNWPPCRARSAAWLPVPAFDNSYPRAASANHIGV